MKDIYISTIILIIITMCFGCSENSTNLEEEIPQDGRGGGVIAGKRINLQLSKQDNISLEIQDARNQTIHFIYILIVHTDLL